MRNCVYISRRFGVVGYRSGNRACVHSLDDYRVTEIAVCGYVFVADRLIKLDRFFANPYADDAVFFR